MKKSTSTKFKVQPLHDRVLVSMPKTSQEEKSEHSVGGIIIPDSVSDVSKKMMESPHSICTVLAIGPECHAVKVGERVVIRKADLFVMVPEIIGAEQTLIHEKHIFAVVK